MNCCKHDLEFMNKLAQLVTLSSNSISLSLSAQVQAGYDASSRSDYDDQAPSLLNSPQPKELQSTSNPGSRSAGSQTAAGVPSPADLSSAFAAAHSSQISSSAHNSPQLPGSAVEDANTAAEPSENQHNAAVELRGSPVIQADIDEHSALSDSPVGQDQAKSSTMGAAEMQVTDALEASTSSNAEATSLHMPTSASSPHSDASSSSKENRPDLNFSSSNDKAHSTGAPLTVRVRMAALTDNPDHISVDLKAGEVDDTAHENAHKDADDTEDAFAADTDETLTASQASESGLSRQGSLSGLSSFAPTPTSHLSEVRPSPFPVSCRFLPSYAGDMAGTCLYYLLLICMLILLCQKG